MKKRNNKVLGRGLEALITNHKGKDNIIKSEERLDILKLDIDKIIPNESQPRKKLKNIDELAESIKMHGVVQPIIVLSLGEKYQLIAGERRWRASKLAGIKKIPAIVKNSISAKDKFEIALIENVQRENLNCIEEALAYKQLVDSFNLSIEKISQMVGKDRSTVSNIIRLLVLPKEIQEDLSNDLLQPGHVRPLINITDEKSILKIKRKIIKNNLSVRQVEKLVSSIKTPSHKKLKNKTVDVHLREIKDKIQSKYMTKVDIIGNTQKGKIIMEYYSKDELERIMDILDI